MYFDLNSGADHVIHTFNIFNTSFTNSKSRFGGAIANLGGILNIINSSFNNCYASFEGGAVYTSWADLNLINSTISNSIAEKNAGAIYFDKGKLTIDNSNLLNNKVIEESDKAANGIYANDVEIYFSNSTFDNGGLGLYANFNGNSKIIDVNKNDDIFIINKTDYMVYVESNGIKLNFTKNYQSR